MSAARNVVQVSRGYKTACFKELELALATLPSTYTFRSQKLTRFRQIALDFDLIAFNFDLIALDFDFMLLSLNFCLLTLTLKHLILNFYLLTLNFSS